MSDHVNAVLRRSASCYFCHQFLEERYLSDHMKHCSSVLDECGYKCGVFVPRKNMRDHLRTCSRNSSGRSSQTADVRDAWNKKVLMALSLMRSSMQREETERKNLQVNLTQCIKSLHFQQESIDVLCYQMKEMTKERRLEATMNQRLDDLELFRQDMKQRTGLTFQQIAKQLKLLHNEIVNTQNRQDEVLDLWFTESNSLKTFLAQESEHMTAMAQDQQQLICDLKLELEMRCKNSSELQEQQKVLNEKVQTLEEEVRKQSKLVAEHKCTIKGLKFQTKENFKYLEELIKDNSNSNIVEIPECRCKREFAEQLPTNGRLLWRIDRYKEKMTEAKETDCVLYSPTFSNKEYGYTLRVELYLNGIGQWKDRHIIGCLRVENGKWDPLLDWPCVLKASVTLRNQENPANDVKKLVKAVGWDKSNQENVEKDSGIYMFIPHTTLTRYTGYVKDDALFLDIRVRDVTTSASTASLAP